MNNPRWIGFLTFASPLLLGATVCLAQNQASTDTAACGTVQAVQTRGISTTRYAFVPPRYQVSSASQTTLVLLPGGSGHIDLDDSGCPRALKGNSLIRSIPLFNAAGFGTALVDAPSDYQGEDGLAGFRTAAQHAQDLGHVIATLRARNQGSIWVVGTSRGAISAANAATRLSGPQAPDGVVLTSALMAGQSGAKKSWVAQSVFDLPLENMRIPLLVIGHAADTCVRSPPNAMEKVAARAPSVRQQVVTVRGGPVYQGLPGLDACEGRTPHGFVDQEAEVADGIARFIRGATY